MPLLPGKKTDPRLRGAPAWGRRRGPGLYAHFYLALFVHLALFVYVVYEDLPDDANWMRALLALYAFLVFAAANLRVLLLDWYNTLPPIGKLGLYFVAGFLFALPALLQGHAVLPEGFLLALMPLTLFAVGERLIRRLLFFSVVFFWFTLWSVELIGQEPAIGYGLTLLWCLAAAHFAFMGEPYGLRGWWPVRRVVGTVALLGLPCSVAAWLAFAWWPETEPLRIDGLGDFLPAMEARRIDPVDAREALIRMVVWLVVLAAMLAALYLLRRFFHRRRKPLKVPQLVGADLGSVESVARETAPTKPGLRGRRGQIVRLWARWAQSLEGREIVRAPGETAGELARRIARENPDITPEAALTKLLEKAHYGDAEPTREEVAAMRRLVKEEMQKAE